MFFAFKIDACVKLRFSSDEEYNQIANELKSESKISSKTTDSSSSQNHKSKKSILKLANEESEANKVQSRKKRQEQMREAVQIKFK
jgi:hypothetical protein